MKALLLIGLWLLLSSSIREQVENTYTQQIGVREEGSNNTGVMVDTYIQACGYNRPIPWCACFITYIYKKNGIPYPDECPAYSPCWFNNVQIVWNNGKKQKTLPQKGDVLGIYFNSKKRIAHVGIVDVWGDKYVVSVEGNTTDMEPNSRETNTGKDRVMVKKRPTNSIFMVANLIDTPKSKNPYKYHKVKVGETVYRISVNYKTTVDRLVALNNLNNYSIKPNQMLRVS